MASSNFNDFVSCPYDKTHRVLRGRLLQHLERCSRNSTIKLKICPFNEVHRFPEEKFGVRHIFILMQIIKFTLLLFRSILKNARIVQEWNYLGTRKSCQGQSQLHP